MARKQETPMPFYVGDWLRCPELRVLPPDVRGLWMDMLCYMWESVERGVMVMPNGQPFPPQINTPEKRAEFLKVMGLA